MIGMPRAAAAVRTAAGTCQLANQGPTTMRSGQPLTSRIVWLNSEHQPFMEEQVGERSSISASSICSSAVGSAGHMSGSCAAFAWSRVLAACGFSESKKPAFHRLPSP
eukprot:scaffold110230_cov66-Phaeocystis_antarctica.AAC.11